MRITKEQLRDYAAYCQERRDRFKEADLSILREAFQMPDLQLEDLQPIYREGSFEELRPSPMFIQRCDAMPVLQQRFLDYLRRTGFRYMFPAYLPGRWFLSLMAHAKWYPFAETGKMPNLPNFPPELDKTKRNSFETRHPARSPSEMTSRVLALLTTLRFLQGLM